MAHTRRMLNEQILKCFLCARFPKGKMMIENLRITEFYHVATLRRNRNTAEYP